MTSHAHGPIVETHSGGHAHDDHSSHGGHGDHSVNIKLYVAVFVALCLLTACSFFTTSRYWPWHDQPMVGYVFMMAVSCTKAMLVILFFMHVLYEANWKYVLTIPAAMMSVFLVIMLIPDIGMRLRTADEERRYHMAEPKSASTQEAHEAASEALPVKQLPLERH